MDSILEMFLLDPSQCPVLSLGINLVCNPSMWSNRGLFYNKCIDDIFNNWLTKILKQLKENEVNAIGLNRDELSSHSIRKGSASFASSLSGIVSIVSVWLRASWSVGGVQPRTLVDCQVKHQNLQYYRQCLKMIQ